MQTITKYFDTDMEADDFQNALYDRHNYVRLVRSPQFSVAGYYSWEVRD